MSILDLLRADLDRQYRLSNSTKQVNLLRILTRIFHPRFFPLVIVRTAQAFQGLRLSPVAQLFAYMNLLLFGIDVASRCEIGPGFFLPHTSGTVIGASRIGRNVTIFQNVTLGARHADMGWNVDKRPTIGDEVTLGAGCKVLGHVHVGNGAAVGANSVVLDDVPEYSTVAGIPAIVVKTARSQRETEAWL